MSYYSRVKYTCNGTQVLFSVPFPYINNSYVSVFKGTTQLAEGTDYVWLNPSCISLNVAPGSGQTLEIRRQTPKDTRLVNFQDGSVLTEIDLDTVSDQMLHVFQESSDDMTDALLTVPYGDGAFLANTLASGDTGKGVSMVGGAVRVVDSIAALKLLPKTGSPRVLVLGYYTPGDGGGGVYYLDPVDVSSTDNGGTLIVATDTGRWKLSTAGFISVKQFGAKGDGSADDTARVTAALQATRLVVIPVGSTFKITSYINIPDNTTLLVLGTVDVANKSGGFYTNGGNNVTIDGNGVGKFTDSSVAANYIWNQHQGAGPDRRYAPAIHFRNSTNCAVKNIVFKYLTIGAWFSNATANSFSDPSSVALSGAGCSNCVAENIYSTYIEGAALQGTVGTRLVFRDNYVYRSGDGGLWMMGCHESDILNNVRESPYGSANDLQGIEIENCYGGRVAGNKVVGFAHYGIDIKNNCKRLTVEHNEILDCETGSIVVRPGDSVQNPSFQITIRNNRIKNNGYAHTGSVIAFAAAVYSDSCFQSEIVDNEIEGYKTGYAIRVTGPGSYYASNFAGNPGQATCVIKRNKVSFKTTGIFGDSAFELISGTPTAIYVTGLHNTVEVRNNEIVADRFLAVDSRVNVNSIGIYVLYNATNIAGVTLWPQQCDVSDNTIARWHGGGIRITGQSKTIDHGLRVSGNNIQYVCAEAVVIETCGEPVYIGNKTIGAGSGAGYRNVLINNCQGVVSVGNSSQPRSQGGTSAATWAMSYYNCTDVVSVGNRFVACASGTVETTGSTNVVTTGNI